MAHVLEIEAEQGLGSFIDEDQVARSVDHDGWDCEAVGQLANQDQFDGQLAQDDTPRRSKEALRVADPGSRSHHFRVIIRNRLIKRPEPVA